MGALKVKGTPGIDLAFDRLIELVQMEELDIPSRCNLIPSDICGFDRAVARALDEEKAVLVIYPDGSEQLIEPGEVRALSA